MPDKSVRILELLTMITVMMVVLLGEYLLQLFSQSHYFHYNPLLCLVTPGLKHIDFPPLEDISK